MKRGCGEQKQIIEGSFFSKLIGMLHYGLGNFFYGLGHFDRYAPLWARTFLETEAKSQRANFTGEKTCLGQI